MSKYVCKVVFTESSIAHHQLISHKNYLQLVTCSLQATYECQQFPLHISSELDFLTYTNHSDA